MKTFSLLSISEDLEKFWEEAKKFCKLQSVVTHLKDIFKNSWAYACMTDFSSCLIHIILSLFISRTN